MAIASKTIESVVYVKGTVVAKSLGVSSNFLRKAARRGELPDGAVICTPGGHMSFDQDKILQWMKDNYKKLTKTSRIEAMAKRR